MVLRKQPLCAFLSCCFPSHSTFITIQGFLSPFFSYHTIERLLSNTLSKTSTSTQKSYSSLASIQAVSTSSQLIDILLTNVWPESITEFSSALLPDPQLSSIGAPPLDEVIRKTKPRYHFASGGGHPPKFWEREPFIWEDEQGRVSRFVSLGAFGEPTTGKKQRVCLDSLCQGGVFMFEHTIVVLCIQHFS